MAAQHRGDTGASLLDHVSHAAQGRMVLIHGMNSAGVEMQPLAEALAPYANARLPDLLGHGGRPIPPSISTDAIARDLVEWLDREGIERAVLCGYSLGGTVALYMARHHPQRVRGVIALCTKVVFDTGVLGHLRHLLARERLERVGGPHATRARELSRIHAPNTWQAVADMNLGLVASFGQPPLAEADFRAIAVPVMVVSSNADQLVPWEEAVELARLVPGSHLAMFYGPGHPLRAAPLLAIARTIGQWLDAKGLREA
jgi:pimeloyl-ACP methyl ester carboxylesterase